MPALLEMNGEILSIIKGETLIRPQINPMHTDSLYHILRPNYRKAAM